MMVMQNACMGMFQINFHVHNLVSKYITEIKIRNMKHSLTMYNGDKIT